MSIWQSSLSWKAGSIGRWYRSKPFDCYPKAAASDETIIPGICSPCTCAIFMQYFLVSVFFQSEKA